MVSIDEQPPPDPSSSDTNQKHHPQQACFEAFASVSDIDLLQTSDDNLDDINNPLSNFSIRDYVFQSRSKDIARNWPFSGKSLQLCLNYGVKNLLPPFKSLDPVRNCSFVSICAVENPSTNEETMNNFDIKTKSNSQPIVKKCKLVVKLNSGGEPIEEAVGSKVCPVCKTFSSSSNTTLNAHIDNCLSEESSMKCTTADVKIKTVKHRIKPRRTRLMVDVYKTAPCCTIEELDRRNGTNWATSSSFPDQELEFQAEEKIEEPKQPTFILPEVADQEGAVYIDKSGKKVRILSMLKFSDLADDKTRVLQKRSKGSKVVIKKKKKKKSCMPKNGKKMLKLSPKSKKTEIGQKGNATIKESCQKEDGDAKPMKAKQMDDLAIKRPPWACFKRRGGAKKRFQEYTKRKEGIRLDDSCDNPIRSKLINLKRKFSPLGKSQDSSQQKSQTEEDTSEKMSFEILNDRKSITSKSSNDDSSSSSGGLEIASESEDCIGIEPSSISTMISQLDNKFEPQQRTLYDIIMEHNSEKQVDYFDEIDPIPIPGPPGSFLPPSPGADIGSEEEPQGNSSLTTMSHVQSSEDHHHHHHHHPEIMNQDFISASSVSTVSSPSFARSADKKPVNNNNNNSNTNKSDLRSDDVIFKENGPTPCCCVRKEGDFFNNVASYPQESAVSIERVTESNELRPELFPLTLPPPWMVKPPEVSPTTPVLRLMGKNLHVVNTDNEQVKPPTWSPMGQYPYPYPHPQNTATKEIIIIDDASDNEGANHHDHRHMFKEPMIRSHAFSFANGNGGLQTTSPFRQAANDGRWVSTSYYPRSFS